METEFLPLILEDDDDILMYSILQDQRPPVILEKSKIAFNLDKLSSDFCWVHFRFRKEDLPRLRVALQIPDKVICRNRIKTSGIEALCVLLKRLAYPNRYSDMMKFFNRTQCEISRIFNRTVAIVLNHHEHKLSDLNSTWLSMEYVQELSAVLQAKGCPFKNCFGFLDGTVRPICRPIFNQKDFYNGHRRTHALKFQSLMLPNGVIGHLYGPVVGRRHDAHLLSQSGLMTKLEQRFYARNNQPYHVYGDPAYPLTPHLMVPFKGHNHTPQMRLCNKKMSSIRESVEWGFNKIVQLFGFLDYKKNLKIGLQPVAKYYTIGALLSNCHTCLYGSETATYFNCCPPNLEEYLEVN